MANNNISTYLTKIMGIFEANLALFGSLVEISLKFKFLPFYRRKKSKNSKEAPASTWTNIFEF